jgi:myosin heavy subunit
MSTEQKSNNTKILVAVIILLIVGMGIAGYFIFNQKTQIEELQEESSLNKQQLEDEYENLSMQYEGFKLNIKNDSLLQKLTNEQAKVQRLLEELKTVKAENKAEISRLNKELATLRQVLKSYIVQIDSLNRANEQLRQEKKEITDKYQQTTRTLNEVTQQKENLTEKVTLAAKLDATNISVQATNSKGKVQKKISKVEQLIINFSITKNITAEPGERTIYVRIMKPDNDVLTKSRANTFAFENRDINYSIKRIVEYGGEEVGVTMYWNVEEYLMPGTYRIDIFADGNRIGMKSFTMED